MDQANLFNAPVNKYLGPRTSIAAILIAAAVAAGILISPLVAITIGAVAIASLYWNLNVALSVFLLGTLLWPFTMSWSVGPLVWTPSRFLFVVLILTWIMAWSNGEVKLERTPLDIALLLFFAAMLVSFVLNSSNMTGDQFNQAAKTFGYYSIELIGLYYIVTTIPKSWEHTRKLLTLLLVIISAVALIGVIEFITEFRFYEWFKQFLPGGNAMMSNMHEQSLQSRSSGMLRGNILRIVSTTTSPHEVGTLMAMSIPLMLYYIGYARSRMKAWYWLGALALQTAAIFLTVTRGALVAVAVAVVVVSIFSMRRFLRSALLVSAATVLIILLAIPTLSEAVLSVSSPDIVTQEKSVQSRLQDWPEARRLLQGQELTGIGLGRVSRKGLDYGNEVNPSFMHTDNNYLSVATETGLLGLASLVLVFGAVITFLLSGGKTGGLKGSEMYDMRIALLSSAVAFMIMCFTFDALGFFTVAKFFWIVVALAVCFARFESRTALLGKAPD